MATPSAVMVSLHESRSAALEQSWSIMVRMVSFPSLSSNLVMKSIVTISNGVLGCSGKIGELGIFCLLVLSLFDWHVAHPRI